MDGGLSPIALVIGDGGMLLFWVTRSDESPDVYFMLSIDECGWEVYRAPAHNDADPYPGPDENGPVGTLETKPAWEQLETLRANVKAAALDYTTTTPPVDAQTDRFTLDYPPPPLLRRRRSPG